VLPCGAAIAVLAASVLASGCVRAEKVRYQRHLTTIIDAQDPGAETLALGLRSDTPASQLTLAPAAAEPRHTPEPAAP
jgi:hypothetical protein